VRDTRGDTTHTGLERGRGGRRCPTGRHNPTTTRTCARGAGATPRRRSVASASACRWPWRAEAAARGLPHSRYVADLLRVALGDLPGGPALAPTPPPAAPTPASPAPVAPAPALPASAARGQVDLRALRIIQFREGRDGEPRQLDTTDKAIVLRILRADLAWLERDGADKDA